MRGFGNLGGLGNMGNLMKQAQKMMEQAKQIEEELGAQTVEGTAGGGMVTAQASGLGKITAITIDPQVVDPDDVEMLQDLILTAVQQALEKADELKQQRQQQLMGGMGLPPGMM
jgi:DNA-binding YbaB/EbfC family protein